MFSFRCKIVLRLAGIVDLKDIVCFIPDDQGAGRVSRVRLGPSNRAHNYTD